MGPDYPGRSRARLCGEIPLSEFVDTNIFVRLLSRDDPEKAERSLDLFRRANRGEIELATSEAVVAEVIYVLASPQIYRTPRIEIAARLGALLAGGGLRLEHKDVVLEALQQYGDTNLSFIDCLCVAHARRPPFMGAIYSYDRGLDRLAGIRRLEP